MKHAWIIAVGGAALAPLVTWLPMLAARVPALGLPLYPPAPGIDLWHLQAFWLVALGTIAALVGTSDRWLGVAVAVAGLTLFYRGAAMDPTHTAMFAFGALLLVGLRRVPRRYDQRIRWLLVVLGGLQGAYAFQQWLGYDLLWGPLLGGTLTAKPQMLGTLGSVNAMAGYVAVVVPLMPMALAIPAIIVIVLSHSLGGVVALIVGLLAMYRQRALAWIAGAGALAAGILVLHKATHSARWSIWQFGAEHWARTDPVLGWGLGGWGQRLPELQQAAHFSPTGEIFREAHNEPLQWLVETGLVGALLLGLWLWEHRTMIRDPLWGPSVAALAANTIGWHSFHIVSTALLGLIVVALASRPQEEPSCAAA